MTVQYRSERETVLKVKSLSGAIFEILDFGQVDELSSLHSMLSSFFILIICVSVRNISASNTIK